MYNAFVNPIQGSLLKKSLKFSISQMEVLEHFEKINSDDEPK